MFCSYSERRDAGSRAYFPKTERAVLHSFSISSSRVCTSTTPRSPPLLVSSSLLRKCFRIQCQCGDVDRPVPRKPVSRELALRVKGTSLWCCCEMGRIRRSDREASAELSSLRYRRYRYCRGKRGGSNWNPMRKHADDTGGRRVSTPAFFSTIVSIRYTIELSRTDRIKQFDVLVI